MVMMAVEDTAAVQEQREPDLGSYYDYGYD